MANAQTVTFNFDTGSPALQAGQNIPFDQTVGGVTAHFSSPNGSAFSVQSDSTLGWTMSQFSGSYLYDNDLNMNPLDIKFSYPITRITLTFATADFHQSEVPSNILLTAYVDSTATAAVGSATAHGTYGSDVYPMGTITFESGGVPFNLVELKIPVQPLGVTDYFVDNITVTPVLLPSCTLALNSPGAALTADGTSTSGFYPTGHLTFTVTPSAGCAGVTWTATSSNTSWLDINGLARGTGTVPATLSYSAFSNTHSSQRGATITVSGAGTLPSVFTVTEAASSRTLLQRQVAALYQQILGREPDTGGFAFWTGLGPFGLGPMADLFLTSPENQTSGFQVLAIYQGLLGRYPSFAEFMSGSSSVRPGSVQTPVQFFGTVLNSPEYLANVGSPSNYSNFVQQLYQKLLGRQPTTTELNNSVTGLTNGTLGPYVVFSGLYGGAEFQNTGAYRTTADHTNAMYTKMLYFLILNRDADTGGFSFWLGIANGGGAGIYYNGDSTASTRVLMLGPGDPGVGFIGSPEFQGSFQ